MRTPVAFMIFNRPDFTERVFAEIARARPPKLLVIADGPRAGCRDEAERCAATRRIVDGVDWPCVVLKNYSDVNLGCAHRPATGLRWVFDQVEEAIILEDDCVPHPSFFPFCEELLDKYREDERVMHISGDQFAPPRERNAWSYSFSRYCLSWGWATWRRAFRHYDLEIRQWAALRDTAWLSDLLGEERAADHWRKIFDLTYSGVEKVNTWDFQWVFACWAQHGLAVLPHTNLISNIGFREDATHTKRATDHRAHMPKGEMAFPLSHPLHMIRDRDMDRTIFENVVRPVSKRSLINRLRGRCLAALPNPLRKPLAGLRSRWVSN